MEQRSQCVSAFGLAAKGEMVKVRLPRSPGAGGHGNGFGFFLRAMGSS